MVPMNNKGNQQQKQLNFDQDFQKFDDNFKNEYKQKKLCTSKKIDELIENAEILHLNKDVEQKKIFQPIGSERNPIKLQVINNEKGQSHSTSQISSQLSIQCDQKTPNLLSSEGNTVAKAQFFENMNLDDNLYQDFNSSFTNSEKQKSNDNNFQKFFTQRFDNRHHTTKVIKSQQKEEQKQQKIKEELAFQQQIDQAFRQQSNNIFLLPQGTDPQNEHLQEDFIYNISEITHESRDNSLISQAINDKQAPNQKRGSTKRYTFYATDIQKQQKNSQKIYHNSPQNDNMIRQQLDQLQQAQVQQHFHQDTQYQITGQSNITDPLSSSNISMDPDKKLPYQQQTPQYNNYLMNSDLTFQQQQTPKQEFTNSPFDNNYYQQENMMLKMQIQQLQRAIQNQQMLNPQQFPYSMSSQIDQFQMQQQPYDNNMTLQQKNQLLQQQFQQKQQQLQQLQGGISQNQQVSEFNLMNLTTQTTQTGVGAFGNIISTQQQDFQPTTQVNLNSLLFNNNIPSLNGMQNNQIMGLNSLGNPLNNFNENNINYPNQMDSMSFLDNTNGLPKPMNPQQQYQQAMQPKPQQQSQQQPNSLLQLQIMQQQQQLQLLLYQQQQQQLMQTKQQIQQNQQTFPYNMMQGLNQQQFQPQFNGLAQDNRFNLVQNAMNSQNSQLLNPMGNNLMNSPLLSTNNNFVNTMPQNINPLNSIPFSNNLMPNIQNIQNSMQPQNSTMQVPNQPNMIQPIDPNLNLSFLSSGNPMLDGSFRVMNENRKSKVIYVRGLASKNNTMDMIYNLFSNFGNIIKMIYMKEKEAVLIEYDSLQNASYTKEFLNNVVYQGKKLKIFFSNYNEINFKIEDFQNKEMDEIYRGTESSFRFKNNKNMAINPPTTTIHVSNLLIEKVTQESIMQIFGKFGIIEQIKFLSAPNQNKHMCLIRFQKLDESLIAVACMHNQEINGKKIQISFTRSKI